MSKRMQEKFYYCRLKICMHSVLRSFYQLDDGGREDVLKIVKILTERHLEEKGVEEIKDLGKRK